MPSNVYDRGGIWWARVTIEGQEYRRSLGLKSARTARAVAEKAAAEWVDGLRAEIRGDAATRTFDAIAEFFILERLPELRPRGAERYRTSLRNLVPHFEGRALGEIDTEALRAFEKARRADRVSSGTIRRDLMCLSAAIRFYADEHDLDVPDVVGRYMRRRARQRALVEADPRTRYLTHDEEARLFATIHLREAKDARLRGLADAVRFAIDTGLRQAEQFGMRWADVDLARKRVRVTDETGKGGKGRVVPLLGASAEILARMPRRLRVAQGEDWIWTRPDGRPYPNRRKAFENAVETAGIADFTWHDLRTTCGCRRLQDDRWSKEQVQLLLGHASVTTTERHYAFLEVDQLETKDDAGAETS